jgi:hypothetical protein
VGVQPVLPADGGTHWLQFISSDFEGSKKKGVLLRNLAMYMFFLRALHGVEALFYWLVPAAGISLFPNKLLTGYSCGIVTLK